MKNTLGAVDGEGCYTGEVKGEEETRQLDEWSKWPETKAWDARWSNTGGIRDWSEERWARGVGEIPGEGIQRYRRTGRVADSAQTKVRWVVAGQGWGRRRLRGRERDMTRKEDLCFHN